MKKVINIIIWLVPISALVLLLGFAITDQDNIVCREVSIVFVDNSSAAFIDEADISKIITEKCDSLVGSILDSINTSFLNTTLKSNSYIKNVAVYKSVSGELQIDIERQQPLVRIINENGENFYLSTEGTLMPVSKKFTPWILVATGNIAEKYAANRDSVFACNQALPTTKNTLASIYYLAHKLSKHSDLNKYIEQIYISNKDEIELVPANGNHYIILGDVNNLDIKIRNLKAFYLSGESQMEQSFSSINLKYINQVVCKK